MTIQRMDNVLIVVDDLEAAKAFFAELGMELEGEAPVEGVLARQLVKVSRPRTPQWGRLQPEGSINGSISTAHWSICKST
jgi:catechol 2,3-dioxygenase-like lactoylglutathione lyase family enzyme